jgi:excisionase family DNA binding protein
MITREKLLTTREASHILGISEKDIINLANSNLIPHFKVAGEFLRFRRDDVFKVKPAIKKKYNIPDKNPHHIERIKEFLYFNDFYIISLALIVVLLWIIIKDIVFNA